MRLIASGTTTSSSDREMNAPLARRSRAVACALVGVALTAGVASAAISATRAIFQPSVRVTIASQLKLFDQRVKLSVATEMTIEAPEVRTIHVFTPAQRYVARPQSFTFSEAYNVELSAVSKPTPQAEVERQVLETLSRRFKLAADGSIDLTSVSSIQKEVEMAPEGITLVAEPTAALHEYSSEGPLESATLAALIVHDGEMPAVVAPKKAIAKKKPVATQVTEVAKAAEPKLENTEPTREVKSSEHLGYSDLVSLMMTDSYNDKETRTDAAPAVTIQNPPHIDDFQKQAPVTTVEELAKVEVVKDAENYDERIPLHTSPTLAIQSPSVAMVNTQAPIQVMNTQAAAGSTGPTSPVAGDGSIIINAGIIVPAPAAPATTSPITVKKLSDENAQQVHAPVDEKKGEPVKDLKKELEKSSMGMMGLDDTHADQPVKPTQMFSGRVAEAFAPDHRGVGNASVQILGTNERVVTADDGSFSFPNVNVSGVLPVIITKDGYLKRRIDLRPNRLAELELVAQNSAQLTAVAAGETVTSDGAFVFGQLSALNGGMVEGLRVEVVGPGLVTPIYLDSRGYPNKQQAMTSARGQFVLLNVLPGTYLVTVVDAFGTEHAPHIVHVARNEGLVRKFDIGQRKMIRGQVLNANGQGATVNLANVQLLGSKKVVTTGADGTFMLGPVYVDCSELNYLQVEKTGFYRNRVDYSCDSGDVSRPLFVFSMGHVDGLAADAGVALNPNNGLMMGHTNYRASVKTQLWGPDEVSPTSAARGKDYYFDTDGVIKPDLNRTTKNGNFTIFDGPAGLSYVQTFSSDNRTLSFWPILLSPSTVNVYVQ